jgi:thiopurine S-methyltransferase
MQPEFWLERWQQNQIGFHQGRVNPYLQQFWPQLGMKPFTRVFVPLCGKSSDMLWLRAQGHEVIGVELSELAIRAFFEENGVALEVRSEDGFLVFEGDGIRLYCGDFFRLQPRHVEGVNAVFDRAALIALPPEMRPAYVAHLHALLVPGTEMLLVSFEYPQTQMQGPPFSVEEGEVRALYHADSIRLLHSADILDQEPRFRERGVTRLQEKVYALAYNPG